MFLKQNDSREVLDQSLAKSVKYDAYKKVTQVFPDKFRNGKKWIDFELLLLPRD